MTIHMRFADSSDVPWLLQEFAAYAADSGMPWLLPNAPVAASVLHGLIASMAFVIAERDGKPVGFLSAHIAPHFLNPDVVVAHAVFWYVTPAARGGMVAGRLLHWFERYCHLRAHHMVVALPPHSPVRSLERRGYRVSERSYLREVA